MLVVVLVLLGIFLYVIGKEYTVLIDNRDTVVGDISYVADATYKVWLDKQEVGVIEKGERIAVKVTGISHKIIVEKFKDKVVTGEKYRKIFKLKSNESFVINIPAMINDANVK